MSNIGSAGGQPRIDQLGARYVSEGASFKPATEGSLLGKVVNWLKETFRPGLVKQENVRAYEAAKQKFLDGGGEARKGAEMFDAGIATGATFTLGHARRLDGELTAITLRGENAQLNTPFSPERRDWLVTELKTTFHDRPRADQQHLVDVEGKDGFKVTEQFRMDLERVFLIDLDGEPIAGTQNVEAKPTVDGEPSVGKETKIDGKTRVVNFCNAMTAKGFTAEDIATMSRVTNQATVGLLGMQAMLAPDLAPGLKMADGNSAPLTPQFTQHWNVRATSDGVEIDFSGGEAVAGKKMPGRLGGEFEFGKNSEIDVAFTLVLKRDGDGHLSLTGMKDAQMNVTAFDTEGRRVA